MSSRWIGPCRLKSKLGVDIKERFKYKNRLLWEWNKFWGSYELTPMHSNPYLDWEISFKDLTISFLSSIMEMNLENCIEFLQNFVNEIEMTFHNTNNIIPLMFSVSFFKYKFQFLPNYNSERLSCEACGWKSFLL